MGARGKVWLPSRAAMLLRAGSCLLVPLLATGPALGAAASSAPKGYEVVRKRVLASGLTHLELAGASRDQRVNVARLDAGSPLSLRPVLAGDVLAGKPAVERTSAMCARVRCLAAVNADFFAGGGIPTGGIVLDGEPVRSATSRGGQLLIDDDGNITSGKLPFSVAFVTADLQRLAIDAVNRPQRRANGAWLFTPRFGRSTRSPRSTIEMTLRVTKPLGPLRLDQTTSVRIVSLRSSGNATIPRDGAVIAARGPGARMLRSLWARARADASMADALIRVDAPSDTRQSIGGRPVLLRDGKIVPNRDTSAFSRSRNPRTIVGWTASGDALLVTVDGRQPGHSEGMTLAQAAVLMRSLGATDAVNLDGGGSTTFVVGGRVVNRPSDRAVRIGAKEMIVAAPGAGARVIGNVERPVAVALAIVDARKAKAASRPPTGVGIGATQERVLSLPAPTAQDPASRPGADLPAIVALAAGPSKAREVLITLATLMWVATGWAVLSLGRFRARGRA